MIKIDNLQKSFGKNKVLKGVNLKVNQGNSLVLLGGSGSGKSVTLKCILGLITADKGKIEINGHDSKSINPNTFLSKIGVLFQGGALFDSMTVWQNVSFPLTRGKVNFFKEEGRELALKKLYRVGLQPEVADQYPSELSGGMQKRVGLARAIALDPDIIFFDEPTTGLDPITTTIINDLIREIVTDMKATTITITHDISSTRAIADEVAFLHEGKIQWKGSVNSMEASKNPYLHQFLNGLSEGPITAIK